MTETIAASPIEPKGHRSVSKVANIAAWVLQVLLAMAFLGAGLSKLAGAPEIVKVFDAVGVGQWLRFVTAILEIGGAVALLFPQTRFFAALCLATIMVFAIAAHLVRIHTNPAPPAVLLALCGTLAYLRR